MNCYIKHITIKDLFHLHNINIDIQDENFPHLMITGKNGSGKTILLDAIAEVLGNGVKPENQDLLNSQLWYTYKEMMIKKSLVCEKNEAICDYKDFDERVKQFYGKVEPILNFQDINEFISQYKNGDFILAYYKARRNDIMEEPSHPTKPEYRKSNKLDETLTDQFLYFLTDLKYQEAMARNENHIEDANEIKEWFVSFEKLLKDIYEDKTLELEYDYKNYCFYINVGGKHFRFTKMSDGYDSIMNIVTDLILKMQNSNSLTHVYNKKGIVLIDEIETHLHLTLQKQIMKILTTIFPNIQFIISTHSPFVLSSLDNAVAFDLEHQEEITDLTQYSYSALAEGYFGVSEESSYVEMQLDAMKSLLEKNELDIGEKRTLKRLIKEFDRIPEPISPNVVGEYMRLKGEYMNKIKEMEAL